MYAVFAQSVSYRALSVFWYSESQTRLESRPEPNDEASVLCNISIHMAMRKSKIAAMHMQLGTSRHENSAHLRHFHVIIVDSTLFTTTRHNCAKQ